MKKIIVFLSLIIVMFMATVPVQATSYIDLISSSCSTYGRYEYGSNAAQWRESSTTSVAVDFGYGSASAKINVLRSVAYLESQLLHPEDGISYSEIIFQPTGASYINMDVSTHDSGDANGSVKLIDETTSETLLDYIAWDSGTQSHPFYLRINGRDSEEQYREKYVGVDGGGSIQGILLRINSSHIYRVTTQAFVGYEDSSFASANISLCVPEPASMLILGLGLLGLAGIKRKL